MPEATAGPPEDGIPPLPVAGGDLAEGVGSEGVGAEGVGAAVPLDEAGVRELLDAVRRPADGLGREDLLARLDDARQRLDRSETVICVVGEFKQGKSALINGLLGAEVCPVDDDLATMAVTVVGHAVRPEVAVHRREDGAPLVEAIPPDDLARWVTERGNPDNRLNVERVDVSLPHPLLERGIVLIDTPGIGGLNAAHAAATLAFLPVADALVFVTDASAELTAAELGFLASAIDAGPQILVALTKIDMYPAWRRILEIDERRLRDIGLAVRPYAVSAVLRTVPHAPVDPVLDQESGLGPFSETILGDVARRARVASLEAALGEVRDGLIHLREPLVVERDALERPEATERMASELREVQGRLAQLTQTGSDWSVRLDDEFAALRGRVEFGFAGAMRQILRETQEEIEQVDPAKAWNDLSQRVQRRVAGAVRTAFLETTDGAAGIQATVAGLLADEEGPSTAAGESLSFDATTLWADGQAFGGRVRTGMIAGFGLLAGATVGVEMLGMLGALLGTAIVGPALLGAALLFGGREVAGERRRQLAERRQVARTFVGQFIEDVRFEVDGRLASLATRIQREMRASFTDRISERLRTYRETAAALQRSMETGAADRERRLGELEAQLGPLDVLAARADALQATATRAA